MLFRTLFILPVFYITLLLVMPIFSHAGHTVKSVDLLHREARDEKIKSLIKALDMKDDEIRKNAAEMLGKIPDIRVVDPLLKALGDRYFKVRRNAALALGEIGDARATDPLIETLNDLAMQVREAAAVALGKLGDKRAIVPLFIALGDRETVVSQAAGVSLKKLGESGGYLLYKAIKVSGKDVYENPKKEIAPRLFDYVLKAFDHWDAGTREPVVWILGSIKDKRTIDFLITILSDEFFNVRRAAVWSLGKIGGKQTIGPLLNALDDSSVFVREAAAWSLGEAQDPSVVAPLIKILDDKNPQVREAALWSLMKIGDKRAVKPAIDALEDREGKVRIAAAWTLGELGDPATVDSLIRALNDENGDVRVAAIWSLSKIADQRAFNPTIKALEDKSTVVRSAAAYTLGYTGDDRAIIPLMDAIRDRSPEVRSAAASALKKLNEPLVDAISATLKGNRKALHELVIKKDHQLSAILVDALNSNRSDIRCAAAWHLGEVKETRATDSLVKMARGWNLRDRFYGMVALPKLKIDGLGGNFLLALKIFLSLPSLIYFLLASAFFTIIIRMIPTGEKKLQLPSSVTTACLVSVLLFFFPATSLTWTYFAFLTTGILSLPFVWVIIKGITISSIFPLDLAGLL